MNELFGISMTLIMVILLAAFSACLVGFAGVYFANRTMFRMGLRNIRRRIEDLGGRFELSSNAGIGTTLRLCLPLAARGKIEQK